MEPWDKYPTETPQAYAAFHRYLLCPTKPRSIDAAFQSATGAQQERNGKPLPTARGKRAYGHWTKWSTQHDWVRRAAAYDEHLAEQDRLLWEERRKQMREREWARGDALHELVERALPYAEQFIHRRETEINGQIVITLSFDVTGLSKVSLDASKLQRLATDEPTDRINLTGAALDAYIARQLARAANGHQTTDGAALDILYADAPAAGDAAEAASETT